MERVIADRTDRPLCECGRPRERNYTNGAWRRTCKSCRRRGKSWDKQAYRVHIQEACNRCGFDNALALDVHHVDGDRENNDPTNLETLCANCHAIEHREGGR